MSSVEPPIAAPPLMRLACVAVVVVLAAGHAWRGLRAYEDAASEARAQGMELVVAGPGDLTIRDIPRALQIRSGDLFGDPHFSGETAWYPFMTPAVAAVISLASGLPINHAYFATGIVLGTLLLAAFGLLLYSYADGAAMSLLPIAMLLGVATPDDGMYPHSTGRLPLTLFLAVAGIAFAARGRGISRVDPPWLHPALGAAAGFIALWQGSYFITAAAVLGAFLACEGVRAVRNPAARRRIMGRCGLLALGMLVMVGCLIVPQLVRYGRFVQSNSARFWLDTAYAGRSDVALWTLPLAPRGTDAMWLAAFLACFAFLPKIRGQAVPLVVAFGFAQLMAHLGFLLDDPENPRLASVAATLLLAPPQTFAGASEFILVVMKLWVLAAAAHQLAGVARSSPRAARWLEPGRAPAAIALPIAAALALAFGAHLRAPRPELFTLAVDPRWIAFAESASRAIEPGASVLGAEALAGLAPFKHLWLPYAAHANPYASPRREAAADALSQAVLDGDRLLTEEILRRYDVRYSVGSSAITKMCGDSVVLRGPGGIPLIRLRPGCGERAP